MKNPPPGLEMKRAALDELKAKRREWINRARKYALFHAKVNGTVSVNDVRAAIPMPEDWNPSVIGAVFGDCSQLVPVGWTYTTSKKAHARFVRIYALRTQEPDMDPIFDEVQEKRPAGITYGAITKYVVKPERDGLWKATRYHESGMKFIGRGYTPEKALVNIDVTQAILEQTIKASQEQPDEREQQTSLLDL